MTKKELLETVTEVYGKLEELEGILDDFRHELKSAKRALENIPDEESEIE